MTFPQASTVREGIRCLARMVREGVIYGRGARMKAVRRFYKPQVKRLFKQQPRSRRRVSLAKQAASGIVHRRGAVTVTCAYPQPEDLAFPPTWSARFVERITFPVTRKTPDAEQHPFRLSLEVRRGSRKININVHDFEQKWLGPTFKVRLRHFTPPWVPPLSPTTYIVFRDQLSEASLCRWLTVILAQRAMLTEVEEQVAVEWFFVRGVRVDADKSLRWKAYDVAKRHFCQPPAGNPSFPFYYERTLRMLRIRESVEDGNPFALRNGSLLSLKELRWAEPNLHRALLDRIATGRVQPVEQDGVLWVTRQETDQVEQERVRNAELRRPKRFPGKRASWIQELVRRGEQRASAQRKIKRWINQLGLSEEAIRASIQQGRVVRVSSRRSKG